MGDTFRIIGSVCCISEVATPFLKWSLINLITDVLYDQCVRISGKKLLAVHKFCHWRIYTSTIHLESMHCLALCSQVYAGICLLSALHVLPRHLKTRAVQGFVSCDLAPALGRKFLLSDAHNGVIY